MKLIYSTLFCILNLFLVQNILAVHPVSNTIVNNETEIIKTTENEVLRQAEKAYVMFYTTKL